MNLPDGCVVLALVAIAAVWIVLLLGSLVSRIRRLRLGVANER